METLIDKIKDAKNFDLYDILHSYQSDAWKEYVKINNDFYNKIKIFENDNVDIYIITWNVSQKANIHDHSDNGCWLKILDGNLIERIYDSQLNLIKTNILKKDDISFMKNDIGFHSIENSSENICVTLHVYSPPNYQTKYI